MRILIIALLLLSQSTIAQSIDTIRVGKPIGDFKKLNYETFEYEVYSEKGSKKTTPIAFTSITTKEIVDGKQYVAIKHIWSGGNFQGDFLSLVEEKTFKPIIQIRSMQGKKEAYEFFSDRIIGLDSASNNAAADYLIDLPHPVFNFEIDLETFSILPFKEGKAFAIPFFHAGNTYSKPAYYKLIVEGKEEIEIDKLGKKLCWVLFMDYAGKQPTRFWYTTKDRKFVKMEAEFNGAKIYKIRRF